jgi:hypothetical protein
VIHRRNLIVLTLLLNLAAGLMTAIFIFRHPSPVESRRVMAKLPVCRPRGQTANFDETTETWYDTGYPSGAG